MTHHHDEQPPPRSWREDRLQRRGQSDRYTPRYDDHYSPSPERASYTHSERRDWSPPRWIRDRATKNLARDGYYQSLPSSRHDRDEVRPIPEWIMERARENLIRDGYTISTPPPRTPEITQSNKLIATDAPPSIDETSASNLPLPVGQPNLSRPRNSGEDFSSLANSTASLQSKSFQKFSLVKPEIVSPAPKKRHTDMVPTKSSATLKMSSTRTRLSARKASPTRPPDTEVRPPALFVGDVDTYPIKSLPEWHTQIKTTNLSMREIRKKAPQSLTAIQSMKDCITRCITEVKSAHDLRGLYRELRDHIHKAEVRLEVNQYIIKASSILTESYGLPRIFREESDFPTDLKADSYQLYLKWARADFDNNILRGIITVKGDSRNGDQLDKEYRKKHPNDPNVYGNAGFVLGQWWPTQMCLLRDGAHGMTQAGITGGEQGAYSIIVSASEYHDKDDGDVIEYSGTKGKGNRVKSEGTQSLTNSLEKKNPVRVFRSSQLPKKNIYRPECGFRYDGLYTVVRSVCLDIEFQIHRFRLERCPGQEPIRCKRDGSERPSDYEQLEYMEMKNKYW